MKYSISSLQLQAMACKQEGNFFPNKNKPDNHDNTLLSNSQMIWRNCFHCSSFNIHIRVIEIRDPLRIALNAASPYNMSSL